MGEGEHSRRAPVIRLRLGDSFEVIATLEGIGAVISDPPYGINFMGVGWDSLDGRGPDSVTERDRSRDFDHVGGNHNPVDAADAVRTRRVENQKAQEWHTGWLQRCFDILPPGGIIKVFSATRTFHRLAAAMEEAGFELPAEHSLEAWGQGQGFPKYLNTSKAIDQHFGKKDERKVVGYQRLTGNAMVPTADKGGTFGVGVGVAPPGDVPVTAAATPEAAKFEGWATALKPGWEPFIVGRKPSSSTS